VPVIPDFIARYPQVKVHITFADHMVDLVAEGDDIGIRLGAAGDESLIARKLGSFTRMICAAPAYLEHHGVPQSPADLPEHNCLLFEGPEALNHWPFRKPDGSIERISVRGNFRCNSGDALFRMLLDGVGLCYAADFGLSHALRSGLVVPVLQDVMLPIEWPIYAAYPARKHLAAKVRVFVDFLVERLTPAPW